MARKTLQPGSRVGHYEVRAPLGAGAMAEVYLAMDPTMGRDVALKVLLPGLPGNEHRLRRFEREASAIQRTSHPNVVKVYEVGWHERTPFIAMEYVPGRTLREVLDENGPLPMRTAVDIGAQLAEGLLGAHESGIVHRDLKPENVMIANDGVVKILDFGLSKPLAGRTSSSSASLEAAETDEALTLPGTILGTLQYMSPEQASGDPVDYRSDQFSLGSILLEMLTGIVPFHRETVPRTLAAIIEGQPAGLEELERCAPAELRSVLLRALAKRPEDRFPSMEVLAGKLRGLRSSPVQTGVLAVGALLLSLLGVAALLM